MTELQLYKFCEDKELRWEGEALLIWISFDDIAKFTQLVGYNMFDEGGILVHLQDNAICLDLAEVCEYFDIEPKKTFYRKKINALSVDYVTKM